MTKMKEAAESYYLRSMRPAAEGSGDYKGLSEYLDDEEKQKIQDTWNEGQWILRRRQALTAWGGGRRQ